tara:strand:- start:282 stop:473 length:192 start_codon:yes stop_codon:yes gene_type:complete
MTVATSTKPATKARRTTALKTQVKDASTQARFATSKLIQNLGSSNDGIQFSFVNDLRTAHGRD